MILFEAVRLLNTEREYVKRGHRFSMGMCETIPDVYKNPDDENIMYTPSIQCEWGCCQGPSMHIHTVLDVDEEQRDCGKFNRTMSGFMLSSCMWVCFGNVEGLLFLAINAPREFMIIRG